jgi:hypothetical protein
MRGERRAGAGTRVQLGLDLLVLDSSVRRRFPRLVEAFRGLGQTVVEIEESLELDRVGTRRIFNDEVFEEAALRNLWASIAKGAAEQ